MMPWIIVKKKGMTFTNWFQRLLNSLWANVNNVITAQVLNHKEVVVVLSQWEYFPRNVFVNK